MHVLFRQDEHNQAVQALLLQTQSRRLLAAGTNSPGIGTFHLGAAGYAANAPAALLNASDMLILHAAMASALNLPTKDLSAKTFYKDGVQHAEFRFEGTEAIALGHSLEMQVLSGAFNPLPTFPIHRIYLEEIFDCGNHLGTQSPFEFSLESIERETHSPLLQAVLQ